MAETVGFLSIRQHREHGYFGGFLILNPLARPLEFHCTLPVQPSRAQVLLYGLTIDEFVCGEQIARALVTKAKLQPGLVITDCPAALALSHVSDKNILMLQRESDEAAEVELQIPSACMATREINLRGYRFLVPYDSRCQAETVSSLLDQLAPHFELDEPFQRIIDALYEAHPMTRAA